MDLFSSDQAKAARDAAMEQVEANADALWKEAAYGAVMQAARELRRFTSDDVFERMTGPETTHEPRALGPIMVKVAREGFIKKADIAPRLSLRRSRHAAPLTVWDSLMVPPRG